jgi:hypothetical protein
MQSIWTTESKVNFVTFYIWFFYWSNRKDFFPLCVWSLFHVLLTREWKHSHSSPCHAVIVRRGGAGIYLSIFLINYWKLFRVRNNLLFIFPKGSTVFSINFGHHYPLSSPPPTSLSPSGRTLFVPMSTVLPPPPAQWSNYLCSPVLLPAEPARAKPNLLRCRLPT